jgi:hypothetical protein
VGLLPATIIRLKRPLHGQVLSASPATLFRSDAEFSMLPDPFARCQILGPKRPADGPVCVVHYPAFPALPRRPMERCHGRPAPGVFHICGKLCGKTGSRWTPLSRKGRNRAAAAGRKCPESYETWGSAGRRC